MKETGNLLCYDGLMMYGNIAIAVRLYSALYRYNFSLWFSFL
ncbi:hypothetical protein SAMN05660236_0196 [Ohtaekwangia koreensis]|uniref:Uncharacterized protein n=1 Tax=Ohtaekwangia koreensis TaxID=688867 RepID=A0A1T5IN10_9BACT|nr:hypothetical protein SAMN05660236_0196 [Ohtaekwangia koreensis]